ncbi:MAG: sigma-70 family RNA polymerase sigma factor [Anaerolinea sp.]|nr:sigma-70 family RNA polymerase sigma factor [Anaerolinea sp.]
MVDEASALLRRMAHGDETALTALYGEYGGVVYSLVFNVLKNKPLAQEVTQDTFLKVWQHPDAWDSAKGQFSSWLLTMARYTAIDRLRREIRRTGKDTELYEEIIADEQDDTVIELERLQPLLHRLPHEQRQLIELAFFKGMKHSELAEALDLPLGTVKTRLRLGLQKLRHWLSEQS